MKSAWHHRLRQADEHVEYVVTDFASEFENIPKTRGREQSGLGALALDDDVRDQRRGMDHFAGLGEHVGNRLSQALDTAKNGFLRRFR